VATQPLGKDQGDEAAALTSIFSLFEVTRNLLKEKGRKAEVFSKVAVVILNQKIRPFTATWHKRVLDNRLEKPEEKALFLRELEQIQNMLRGYAAMLAKVAGVEDFQKLEQGPLQEW
jgi:hypothetical protein